MLQGLAQFRVALAEFFEQPDVLDGDYGLRGESFEKCDLFLRERLDYSTTNDDDANRLMLAHEGRCEDRSDAEALGHGGAFRKLFCGDSEHIFNVDYIAVDDRTANRRATIDCS